MKKHDPLLICLEIAALQCLYYALLGAYFICCHLLYGLPLSMDRFFSTGQKFDFETTELELPHWTWWLCRSRCVVMIVLGEYALATRRQDIPSPGGGGC
ncbi:trans Golgi network membrane protein [Aureococcus anophagefferens]|uniref:Trans Golgi network membrane protein n=1 Tax=Aureococcus anophagefferens TaxID=44056 RepID=A0ABR1FQD6_AURAN